MQGYEKTTGKTVSGCCVLPLSRMRGSLSGDRRNEPGGERDSVLWKKAERLVPGEADSVRDVMDITYQITGGYNDNAVRVSWKMKPYGRHPEWIYLKTFTGGYLKYVMEGKHSPMVFALADTDAFVTVMKIPAWNVYFGVREDLSFMFMIDRPDSLRYPWIR